MIIPCSGISYKRYLAIAERANKRVSVITDNDGKSSRIIEADEYNSSHNSQHVFMDKTIDGWTWEACFYRENEKVLNDLIEIDPKAKYLFHKEDYGPVLGKMLNNKADVAYKMLMTETEFAVPQYVQDSITWLNE